jgi:hypothetical protein
LRHLKQYSQIDLRLGLVLKKSLGMDLYAKDLKIRGVNCRSARGTR